MPDDRRSVGVRVRPDARDFIRQLRADLATKKYTFYVDVKANTGPATRDVRIWAATQLQKIHASVPVSANTGPATRDMADWRRRQAGIRTEVKVHADTSAAVREIEQVRAMAKDVTIRVKADVERARNAADRAASGGGRSRRSSVDKDFAAGLKSGLDAAYARLGEIQTAAKKPIQIGLELDPRFDYRLQNRLAQIRATAKAKPIELPVEADIKDLERQILAGKIIAQSRKLKVPVEYDPTDLRQMKLQLTKLRLLEESRAIKLNVEVSRSSLERVKKAMDQVGKQFGNFTLIRSLDVGPFNLGKPSGLVGTISNLTVLAGALPGVTAGAAALADGLVRLAGAAGLVPGAIGAIGASLATLTIGTKGIGDAFTSLFALWDEGASQQEKSSTRLIAAQNNYKNAVVDEGRAQEKVATARRQALGELRNLNNELRGGVLNEAQALLDLQKARDRYAQGGFDNETDRIQAQLDIKKAEQGVINVREDNLNLQQKANEENKKGVEGSDQVVEALDGVRRASDATAQALEALSAGGAGATTAAQKFQDQLSQLSPNAQDFVMSVAGMKDEMYGFRNAIQDTIFQGAGPAFREMFTNLLPAIQPGMQQIAKGLNQNLLQVFDTLQSPDGKSIIERILGGTAETQQALTGLINPLIKGVGTLVAASTEHMPQVVELFTRLADRFSIFIEEADKNGSLDEFLDKGVGALSDMAEIGLNLIQIVNDLSDAFGGNILTDIKSITDSWHAFLSSDEGQAKLKQFLEDAQALWDKWKPVLEQIPPAFSAISDAATRVLGFLLPTIENILGFLNKFPGALELIATTLITSKLLGSFSSLARTVGLIFTALQGMPGLINKIPGVNIPGLPNGGAGGGPGNAPVKKGLAEKFGPFAASSIYAIGGAIGLQALPGVVPAEIATAQDFPGADSRAADKLAAAINWINAATTDEDKQKRADWVKKNVKITDTDGWKAPNSYMSGGYTDWGIRQGRIAELHGGEYVQPHDTVGHYGVEAMKAVHDKRAVIGYERGGGVPMANPNSGWGPGGWWGSGVRDDRINAYQPGPWPFPYGTGGRDAFRKWIQAHPPMGSHQEGGLVWDPNTGQYVPVGAAISHGQAPGPPGPGIIDSVVGGVAQGASSSGNFFGSFMNSLGIPGFSEQDKTGGPGWGEGGPPIGLGGGADGFDIRKFGIGPGPAGSGPSDWMSFAGQQVGKFSAGLVTTFASGILGGLGLSGLSSYVSDAAGIADHFATTATDKSKIQGPGAAQTNADALNLLGTYNNMATNPAYPGIPSLPDVFNPATGSAIDPNSPAGRAIISAKTRAVGQPYDYGGSGPGTGSAGGYDCSGIASAIYSDATGNKVRFTSDPAQLLALGFQPGFMPGALNVGVKPGSGKNGHVTLTLPNGVNVESGGGHNTTAYGGPAAGALDLPQQFYLPLPSGFSLPGALPPALSAGPVPGIPLGGPGLYSPENMDPALNNPLGVTGSPIEASSAGRTGQTTSIKDLARKIYAFSGLPPNEFNDFQWLIQKESSWNPAARNASNHFGLIQFSEENRAAYGLGDTTDPAKQLAAATRYIKERYGGSPRKAHQFHNANGWFDKGGWLPPGQTQVTNMTGKPELLVPYDMIPGFAAGGLIPYRPKPRPPDVIAKRPPPPAMAPKPAVPAITPPSPPVVTAPHIGTGTPPGPQAPPAPQGPGGAPISLGPIRPATGPGGDSGSHVLPAISTGITSGFATAGSLAGSAISMGMGGAGIPGGGAAGQFVQGLFQQAGKIANSVANVASSFLVGNITGGTTENPYGVTQRGNVPTGGTRVVDASSNHVGDIYTNNLEEYFKLQDRRNAQKAQSGLGRWGSQV